MLQKSNGKTKKQRKTEAANQNPKDYINDPRVPSNLKSSIIVENLPDLEGGWLTSGPQLHPTKFPDLQQRYCSPKGKNDYCKSAAIYTIAIGNRKDDAKYRLLHVYSKTKKGSTRNIQRGQLQEKPKAHKRTNHRKFKVAAKIAAKRICAKDHNEQLDSHLHERKSKPHIDQVCLEEPTHRRSDNFLNDNPDPYFLQMPNLFSDFPVPLLEMEMDFGIQAGFYSSPLSESRRPSSSQSLPFELKGDQAILEVYESWQFQ